MDDFYLTLISNSSAEYYPNNTTSSFTVHLPQKLMLKGIWCAGVAEIHYKYNFFNVTDGNNVIFADFTILGNSSNKDSKNNSVDRREHANAVEKHESAIFRIEPGFYKSVVDVVTAINKQTADRFGGNILEVDSLTNRTIIRHDKINKRPEAIYLKGRLAIQLGFQPNVNLMNLRKSPNAGNVHFGVPDQMLVYTDIMEPTIIGHEKAYVIKIVNTAPKSLEFGDSCYTEFQHIHYMVLQRKEFESISIDIRDYTGEYMPFLHGVLTVKLHFKKVRNE